MEVAISNSFQNILSIAINAAMESPQMYRHGAVVFTNRKKIVKANHNTNNRTKVNNKYYPSIHAEINCLLCITEKELNAPSNLLVIRINPSGNLCNSRPCIDCLQYIKKYTNIKKIYYSNECGNIIMEKVKYMKDNYTPRVIGEL